MTGVVVWDSRDGLWSGRSKTETDGGMVAVRPTGMTGAAALNRARISEQVCGVSA